MHVFLTGEIQTGKSTALRRFLAQTGISADGFLTFFEVNPNGRELMIERFDSLAAGPERYCAARASGMGFVTYREVFDTHGAAFLSDAGRRSLILMDELGTLEEGSTSFKEAVLRRLDGNIPVIGVLKPRNTPFLNAVRTHAKVEVIPVTQENRDTIPEMLAGRFGWLLR